MPDKVQREIEELLDKLDNFVPEERFTSKMRDRRRQECAARSGPSPFERARAQITHVTLGHVMIAGFACFVVAFFFGGFLGDWARWLTIAALVLTGGAFLLSVMNRGAGSRTPLVRSKPGGRTQKVWRGQVIEYGGNETSALDRLRGMFRRKGRQ